MRNDSLYAVSEGALIRKVPVNLIHTGSTLPPHPSGRLGPGDVTVPDKVQRRQLATEPCPEILGKERVGDAQPGRVETVALKVSHLENYGVTSRCFYTLVIATESECSNT